MQIAVLGGGLTGLSATFHLAHRFPKAQVLLFEKSSRLGGWVKSESVDVDGRRVILEGGPRTLRPKGAAVLELIRHLGIEDELIAVSNRSPTAKKRYIYVPPGQVQGVSGLNNAALDPRSPLMRHFLWSILRAPLRYARFKHNQDGSDESIHTFASRVLGDEMATTIGSAIIHGIYAADSRKLSAHSTLPFWSSKSRNKVLNDSRSNIQSDVMQPYPNVGRLGDALKNTSVYSFRNGMETLPRALEYYLERRSNVQVFRESSVLSLLMRKDCTFDLSYLTSRGSSTSFATANPTHIVSALPLPTLQTISQPQLPEDVPPYPALRHMTPIPHLPSNTSSSVHVLNFIFPTPPSSIHPPGFGYLIPRPLEDYPSQASDLNPGILGVVFDSCSTSQQDEQSMSPDEWYCQGTHTKITVMLGGPYPLYIPPSVPTSSAHPTPTTNVLPHHILTILNHLSTHLSRPLPAPIYYHLWRNDNCIPTYSIGHSQRMQEMHAILNRGVDEGGWGGRVEIVGAGVDGVSVPDCVLAGRNVGLKWLSLPPETTTR